MIPPMPLLIPFLVSTSFKNKETNLLKLQILGFPMDCPKSQTSNLEPTSPVTSVADSNSFDTTSESSLPFDQIEHDYMIDSTNDFQELELRRLLFLCAQSISREDYEWASQYLPHINRLVSPLATNPMQRLAFCFAQGLTAKLAAALSIGPALPATSLPVYFSHETQILEAYQILYEACPYVKFSHKAANQAILQAFENEDCVHILDLGIGYNGNQWPPLMHALASRPGGSPFLRLTGVGYPPEYIHETGKNLSKLATNLRLRFKFHPIELRSLQELKPHMFQRQVWEALAVNCINVFHQLATTCLGNLLVMIRNQAPNIVTLVEREASLNDTCFDDRFHEAWCHFAALFSSLNRAFLDENSLQRAKIEQYIMAPQIRNILACEGAERVERYEKLDRWKKIMTEKRFHGVAMTLNSNSFLARAKTELEMFDDGYSFREQNGSLVLCWRARGMISISAWH